MAIQHAQTRRWTVDEYCRLAEDGLLGKGRFELIDGEIICMAAQNTPHVRAIFRTTRCLVRTYGDTHHVGVQVPFPIGDWSDPEPDFVVVSLEWFEQHPGQITACDLIIEVADSSLAYDRSTKGGLYAAAGVPEYWILNVRERQLEVYREPRPMAGEAFAHGYRQRYIHAETDMVAPLFCPGVSLRVSDLMDPA